MLIGLIDVLEAQCLPSAASPPPLPPPPPPRPRRTLFLVPDEPYNHVTPQSYVLRNESSA